MKSNIPMPVVVGIIVIVVAAVGFWLWKSGSGAPSDVKALSQEVNQGKPATNTLPPDSDTMMMGGKKGGN